nr:uncharacterized protein LOC131278233 [Dasypus novemcinctus]
MVREDAETPRPTSKRSPLTYTQPEGWGQKPRKLNWECAKGPTLPTLNGCWRHKPLCRAGPGISCLPTVRSDGGSSWPRRAPRSSRAVAHCIFAPAGRRGLGSADHCPGWLGRGSAGLRGRGARMVGSGDGRYLIASLPGCPTPLAGSPRSAALLRSAPSPVRRTKASSPPHILAVPEEELGNHQDLGWPHSKRNLDSDTPPPG